MKNELKKYIDRDFYLRIKNLALVDYFVSNDNSVYFEFTFVDGFEHETEFYDGFDINLNHFILLVKNNSKYLKEQITIIPSFQRYILDSTPITLLFSRKNYFELWFHNGLECEEGWFSDGYDLYFDDFKIISKQNPSTNNWLEYSGFSECSVLLDKIHQIKIPVFNEKMNDLRFDLFKRMMKFGVHSALKEIINFVNDYYLLRSDIQQMRLNFAKEFDELFILCNQLINVATEMENRR